MCQGHVRLLIVITRLLSLTWLVYPTQLHMAEHPAGHLVLKWLIEQDVMLAEAGKEGKKKNKKKRPHIYTHTVVWL